MAVDLAKLSSPRRRKWKIDNRLWILPKHVWSPSAQSRRQRIGFFTRRVMRSVKNVAAKVISRLAKN
ncbi:MAG: hypothetical protein DME57_02195 [Verrucomicrobia bacterium]|nr:MAG: hypothetical protein DME57_02195 [Verrucomicrobiota bacterium]